MILSKALVFMIGGLWGSCARGGFDLTCAVSGVDRTKVLRTLCFKDRKQLEVSFEYAQVLSTD